MSRWTEQWRDFVRRASYVHNLTEEKISNDQFWRSYGIYDQVLMHSGYPGEILSKISSFISPEATFLDIGAGTGAFAIPLSRKTSRTIAVDPSEYQLQILSEKARQDGLTNIFTIEKEWKDVDISAVDYSLAAYSLLMRI
jgi:2-polyprenyl-3-methyl-5-hydroxy-6-metoxy-1,4-benzoquinol methylase